MSRLMLLAIPFAALLAVGPATAATSSATDDGCTQANPCHWVVDVDENGLSEGQWNWSAGDYLRLEISNIDDVAHTVSIDGTGVSVTAGAIADAQSAPFQLTAGTYTLRDSPSGDTAKVNAVDGDVVAYENGLTSKGGIPGFEGIAAIAALAAAVLMARRTNG